MSIARAAFGVCSLLAPKTAARYAYKLWFRTQRHPLPAEERDLLQDSTRSEVAWADGRSVQTYTWGEGPSDKPVALLVHGWRGRAAQFHRVIAFLAARGYRVVAFDAPGHGASHGDTADLPAFVAAFRAVHQACGPVSLSVGHSMGAAAMGRAMEDGARVAQCVMIAPPCSLSHVVDRQCRDIGLGTQARLHFRELFVASYGPGVWDRYDVRMLRNMAPEPTTVTIIHDENDKEIPCEWGLLISQHLPRSRFIKTAGLGHRRILRDDALLALIGEQLDTKD